MSLANLRLASLLPARSWRRRLMILFSPLLLLLVVGLFLLFWGLHTAGGARWAWRQLTQAVPGLSAERLQGSLSGGLQIDGLGFTDGATQLNIAHSRLSLDVDWLPWPKLQLAPVELQQVRLQLASDDSSDSAPLLLPQDLSAPVLIQLQQVSVDDFQLLDAQGETTLSIRTLKFDLDYEQQLDLRQLQVTQLQAGPLSLDLAGQAEIALQAPFPHQIQLQPHIQLSLAEQEPLRFELMLNSEGDLDKLQADLSSRDQNWLRGLQLQARVENILQTPQLDAQWQLAYLHWPVGASPQVQLEGLQGRIHGAPQALELALNWHQQLPSLAAGVWRAHLQQNATAWQLKELLADLHGGQLQASGQFDLEQQGAQVQVDLPALDLAQVFPEQAETLANLSQWQGKIRINGSTSEVQVEQLELSQINGPATLTGDASWQQENGQISANIDWHELTWNSSEQSLGSEQGSLRLSGRQDDYQLEGQAQLSAADYPPGQFVLRGKGDENQFQLEQLHVDWLGGEIQAAGELSWQPQLAWTLNLSSKAINPQALVPALAGELNLQAQTRGQQEGDDWDALLELKQLSGTLQGRPLGGQGSLRYRQGQLSSAGLKLNSGATELLLQSAPAPADPIPADPAATENTQAAPGTASQQALHWQLQLRQLGNWLDDATGSLAAHGWLQVTQDHIVGAAAANSPQLGWQDWQLQQLQLESRFQLPLGLDWQQLHQDPKWLSHLELRVAQVQGPALDSLAPWQGISDLSLKLENQATAQQLTLSAFPMAPAGSDSNPAPAPLIGLHLEGSGWPALGETFSAELARLQLSHPQLGPWTLVQEVPLTLMVADESPQNWQFMLGQAFHQAPLDPEPNTRRQQLIARAQPGLCLKQDTSAAQLCLHSQWQAGAHQLQLGLENFALSQLKSWIPDWNISQSEAELGLYLAHHADQLDDFALETSLSPGWISPATNNNSVPSLSVSSAKPGPGKSAKANQFSLDLAQLSAALDADAQIQIHSLWALEGDARLEARLALANWQSSEQNGEWPDSVWASQHPNPPRVDGKLDLNWQRLASLHKLLPQIGPISGELAGAWQFHGPWLNPGVEGRLDINQLNWSDARTGLRLRQGELHLHSGAEPTIGLEGNFLLGSGRAEINGQLDVAQRQWQLQLNGETLELLNGPQGKLYASPQLAIRGSPEQLELAGEILIPQAKLRPVAGNNPVRVSNDVVLAGETVPAPTPGPAIFGQLHVAFGDAVQVNADNARARLSGALDLHWQGDVLPQAEGQIKLEQGGIRAYGQNLDLQRGLILFENGPVDDPRLEIRAARRIFGDPSVDLAGVQVEGTAQNPRVRLFTEPSTNEERALSYLVTGSNFDHGNGQGALSVGIYILPRLFVSYGFGLFENGNVLSTRYELSDHWSVQTISGARDTGVDLSWSVDR